jgi:hypothetical protein
MLYAQHSEAFVCLVRSDQRLFTKLVRSRVDMGGESVMIFRVDSLMTSVVK